MNEPGRRRSCRGALKARASDRRYYFPNSHPYFFRKHSRATSVNLGMTIPRQVAPDCDYMFVRNVYAHSMATATDRRGLLARADVGQLADEPLRDLARLLAGYRESGV
jgi:hypothetical protein